MAFDGSGAAGGAASGATAGMAAGPWGAVAGGVIGGLAGGLLGKKKVKTPDMMAIRNEINNSAARQGEIASNVKGQLAPLTANYDTGLRGLATNLQDQTKKNADQYVVDQENASSALNRNLSDTLKQRVLETNPELQRNLREGLAASGQSRNGAAAAAQAGLSNQLAQQIGQGQREITTMDLQARQQALAHASQMNDSALQAATGMNRNALTAVFNSGRQDLIDEATALINIEANRSAGIAGALQNQNIYDLASQFAANANSNQLQSSLTGLIGSVAGKYGGSVGSKAPAASGYDVRNLTTAGQPPAWDVNRMRTSNLNLR